LHSITLSPSSRIHHLNKPKCVAVELQCVAVCCSVCESKPLVMRHSSSLRNNHLDNKGVRKSGAEAHYRGGHLRLRCNTPQDTGAQCNAQELRQMDAHYADAFKTSLPSVTGINLQITASTEPVKAIHTTDTAAGTLVCVCVCVCV